MPLRVLHIAGVSCYMATKIASVVKKGAAKIASAILDALRAERAGHSLLLLSATLIACSSPKANPISFFPNGSPEQMRLEEVDLEAIEIFPTRELDETSSYLAFYLDSPMVVRGAALFFRYRPGATTATALALLGEPSEGESPIHSQSPRARLRESRNIAPFFDGNRPATSPDAEQWAEVRIPLPDDSTLRGFAIVPAEQSDEIAMLPEVIAAGLAESIDGMRHVFVDQSFTDDRPSLASGIVYDRRIAAKIHRAAHGKEIEYDIGALWPTAPIKQGYTTIGYRYEKSTASKSAGDFEDQALLTLIGRDRFDSHRESSHTIRLKPGSNDIFFYPNQLSFTPRYIIISPPTAAYFAIEKISVKSPRDFEPLPIDMGMLLHQRPAQLWRNPDYEVFSWNLYPETLIIDSANYAIQSHFFKRLAFFVEKRGYRSTLLTDEELATRFGWNAHDFRAEDLAHFYQTAADQKISLNNRELTLQQILIDHGIISLDNRGNFLPGKGSVLGISQESYPALRDLLLTHEAMHGLFFTNTAYREAVTSFWNRISEDERELWRLLLADLSYDPSYEYLIVNEFQAYLMQQHRDRASIYLRNVVIPRFLARNGDKQGYIADMSRRFPTMFKDAAKEIDRIARETAGVSGGGVSCVSPSL